METVRYLCEFFFCNLWHYVQLLVLAAVVCDCFYQINNTA